MGFPGIDRPADDAEILFHPQRLRLMTDRSQRGHDVELRLPFGLLDIDTGRILGRNEMLVHEHQDFESFHSATRRPPVCT